MSLSDEAGRFPGLQQLRVQEEEVGLQTDNTARGRHRALVAVQGSGGRGAGCVSASCRNVTETVTSEQNPEA